MAVRSLDDTRPDRRLLVITEPRLGDIVVAHPFFRMIKEGDPSLEIDALIPPIYQGLVNRMPEVSRQWLMDINHLNLWSRKTWRLCADIRRSGYEQAIVMTRSSRACALVLLAGIKIRTGFKQVRPFLLNDLRGQISGILQEKTMSLLPRQVSPPEHFPLPCLSTDEQAISSTLERFGLNVGGKPLIAIAPGATTWSTKKWPLENFIELCRKLTPDYSLYILGGEAEIPLGQAIVKVIPEARNLCGHSTIDEAVNLVAAARCIIANDSGLLHVAAAVGTPLVGIYGPTSPIECPPWTDKRVIIWKHLDCSPCFQDQCPLGHHACMMEIEPDEVLAELSGLVSTTETPR